MGRKTSKSRRGGDQGAVGGETKRNETTRHDTTERGSGRFNDSVALLSSYDSWTVIIFIPISLI